MNGIIVIDKPKNFTSFDIIAILRKKFNQKKIGHMGTLDPLATGVLPVLLGETAKFQRFVQNHDKKYVATMNLGMTTDTLDITGKILTQKKSYIQKEEFEEALNDFKGEIYQIPPMFSAIKKDGQKLYDLARRGIEIEREKRKVTIKSLSMLTFNEKSQEAVIEVACSQGTYIRTLCADIGDVLKSGAVMTELRREGSNGFKLSESVSLEKINRFSFEEIVENFIYPTEHLFKELPCVTVTSAQAIRFKNGGSLSAERLSLPVNSRELQNFIVYNDNNFIGLGKLDYEMEELRVLKCENFA